MCIANWSGLKYFIDETEGIKGEYVGVFMLEYIFSQGNTLS